MPAVLHIVATVAVLHFAFELGVGVGVVRSTDPIARVAMRDTWVRKNAMRLGRSLLIAVVASLVLVAW